MLNGDDNENGFNTNRRRTKEREFRASTSSRVAIFVDLARSLVRS